MEGYGKYPLNEQRERIEKCEECDDLYQWNEEQQIKRKQSKIGIKQKQKVRKKQQSAKIEQKNAEGNH